MMLQCAVVQKPVMVALLVCLGSALVRGRAQGCGDNPMKDVLLVAKRTGRTLTHVLTLLRNIDGGAYDSLADKFNNYASCVGLVDTAFFRKRSPETAVWPPPPPTPANRLPTNPASRPHPPALSLRDVDQQPTNFHSPSYKNDGKSGTNPQLENSENRMQNGYGKDAVRFRWFREFKGRVSRFHGNSNEKSPVIALRSLLGGVRNAR